MKRCALAIALSLAVVACKPSVAPPAADAPQAAAAPAVQAAPYQVKTFNPGEKAIFQVASNLVVGANEVLLVDAQFAANDAQHLVEEIRATGKPLKIIFISHGDPDFYFGLATVLAAFPEARVIATPRTVAHIRESAEGKLAYWKPILGEQAPARVVIPEVFEGKTLSFDGGNIDIFNLDGPTPDRTVLWIPAIRTVLGGVPVMAGEHVWMADTQTPQSHTDWLALLEGIAALKPERVVPGHFAEGAKQDMDAVRFTGEYIRAFDEETPKAADAKALVAAMKQRYPGLAGEGSLDISAKVAKGEMKWP